MLLWVVIVRPKKEWYDAAKTWYLEKRVASHLKQLHAYDSKRKYEDGGIKLDRKPFTRRPTQGIDRRVSGLSMREAQNLSRRATYPDFENGRPLEYGERNREADLRDRKSVV